MLLLRLRAPLSAPASLPCPAVCCSSARLPLRCCLLQPDRQVLGDIVLWFAASAVAEPAATLVMAQATKQDKGWLSG